MGHRTRCGAGRGGDSLSYISPTSPLHLSYIFSISPLHHPYSSTTSTLHHHYITPTSHLDLPCISPISPAQIEAEMASQGEHSPPPPPPSPPPLDAAEIPPDTAEVALAKARSGGLAVRAAFDEV